MKRCFVAWMILVLSAPVWSATYEETFTPKANKAYSEDINVWVYTSEFAERFGMPEKWIDDELEGAYAVAFRVETRANLKRFPHKGANVTMPIRDCILDVYLPSDADTPWADEQVAGIRYQTPDSRTYLAPQTPEDRVWRRRAVGLPNWGGVVQFGTGEEHLGGFPVREYDKRVYPGVAYISFSGSCVTPPKTASWIEFHDYKPRSSPKPVWAIRTIGVMHRIDIPASFMRRFYDDWYRKSRRPARGEWNKVIERKGD